MPDLEPGNVQQQTPASQTIFHQSSHPIALFFHLFFRTAAIVCYLLANFLFPGNFIFAFVIIILLLAFDFWTVKKISGRRLAGIMWDHEVDETGNTIWLFQSRDPSRPVNSVDSNIFWMTLYVFPLAWIVLFFTCFITFSFSYLPIVILALLLNFTNVVGFFYADRDAKKRWAQAAASSGLLSSVLGGVGGLGGRVAGLFFRG